MQGINDNKYAIKADSRGEEFIANVICYYYLSFHR